MNVVARTSLTRVRLHITYFLLFVRRTVRQVGQETVGVVVRTVASGRPDVKRVMLDWWCLGMRSFRLSKRHAGRALSSRRFRLLHATNRTPLVSWDFSPEVGFGSVLVWCGVRQVVPKYAFCAPPIP